jgi:hypothetical protein
MLDTSRADRRSACVELYLDVDGGRLRVAQVGPDWLILRDRVERLEASHGRLSIIVDGKADVHEIVMPNGVDVETQRVAYF